MRKHYRFPPSYVSKLANAARKSGTYNWSRQIDSYEDNGWVTTRDQRLLMLAGYSYLGFIRNKNILARAEGALARFGLGTHGTRPNCGTISLHNQLEAMISRTNNTSDSVLYPSGFQANFSTISALVGEGDIIISDELNHASIVDGCRLSGAKRITFKHNDVDDLREKLASAASFRNKLVIVDAVFSMDGDIAPLPTICQLCDDYQAVVMVDEAHSFGVLGKRGFGITEHFGLAEGDIDVITGVLSKTVPGTGGYASGTSELADYLKHNARSYIFSGAISPFSTAVAIEAISEMISNPHLIEDLRNNTTLFHEELRSLDVDIATTVTPITPLIIKDVNQCLAAAQRSFENGIYLVAVPFPLVPIGRSRLRATVTADHKPEDLRWAAHTLGRIVHEPLDAVSKGSLAQRTEQLCVESDSVSQRVP